MGLVAGLKSSRAAECNLACVSGVERGWRQRLVWFDETRCLALVSESNSGAPRPGLWLAFFLCGTMQYFPSARDNSACKSGVTKINAAVGFSSGEGLICVRPAALEALCLIEVH